MVVLRPATQEGITTLRHWDQQAHNIEANPHDDWQWQDELGKNYPWREPLIAELDGRKIGFIEIIDPALEKDHY